MHQEWVHVRLYGTVFLFPRVLLLHPLRLRQINVIRPPFKVNAEDRMWNKFHRLATASKLQSGDNNNSFRISSLARAAPAMLPC